MENYPEYFREYADLLTWDKYWHTTLDTSNPPLLEVVRWGQTQRLLQLRRQARSRPQEQGGLHLGGGTRGRAGPGHHLPGPLRQGQRVRRPAARLLRAQGRRPRHPPHADATGAPCRDARLRQARRRPLPGLRRLQRLRLRRPDRRLREPRTDHDGRLPPERRPARPQDQGRRGRGTGREGRGQGRQGSGVAPVRRQGLLAHPHGRGPRLLR